MMMHFKVGKLHPNSPHLFADLAELLVLIGLHGQSRLHKSQLIELRKEGEIHSDELSEEQDFKDYAETEADVSDRMSRQVDDVWSQLEYREESFEGFYPFKLDDDYLSLEEELRDKQKLYVLMLSCSRLRSFDHDGTRQLWAKNFTTLSREATVALAPVGSDIKIFDANSDDRRSYYGTDYRQALIKLGEDLSVININTVECQKQSSSGDGGLDIVAIYNFNDSAVAAQAIFGQCGAQETEWPKKNLEATPQRFSHALQFQVQPSCVMFTPVCYRNADGSWVQNSGTNQVLLLDRYRILSLISQESSENITAEDWFIAFWTALDNITEIDY